MERPFPAYSGDKPYIFVSYAHDDAELVYPEITRLKDEGFNIWYDEGINPGATWRDEVALALTQCSVFLYFMSPKSVASSNCLNEVNFCLSRERKILSVHLTKTVLPIGLELSLSAMQAIIQADHAPATYNAKLSEALESLLPTVIEPVSLPGIEPNNADTSQKSIGILPFANRSADPANQYLCEGIAEELIIGLAKIKGLKVASQLSSFSLKDQSLAPDVIGARLKVNNVLTGSIQKSGEKVRIAVALSEAKTSSVIWSERYDGTLDDVFALQEDVARKVIGALQVELGSANDGLLVDAGTQSAGAYQSFLLGKQEFSKQTRAGLQRARDQFKAAVTQDPSFGRAYWLAFISWTIPRNLGFLTQEEYFPDASEVVEKMRQTNFVPPESDVWIDRFLDPSLLPDARTLAVEAIDNIRDSERGWQGSEYYRLGRSLIAAGLLKGARQYLAHYMEHSAPHTADSNVLLTYGNLLFTLGRFEEAIHHFTNIFTRDPTAVLSLGNRAMLYSRTGQYSKAETDLKELAKTFPRNFAQFYDLYWHRELDAAKAYFEWLDGQRNLNPVFRVWGCFLLGDIEKGMDYLEQANLFVDGLRNLLLCALTPSIQRQVTSHPRYIALLAGHGMDDDWRDELLIKVNELEPITGIRVSLDEDY